MSEKKGELINPRNSRVTPLMHDIATSIYCTGAALQGELERAITASAPKRYKYIGGRVLPRPYGGVNTLLFGDFWQLDPVGQARACIHAVDV